MNMKIKYLLLCIPMLVTACAKEEVIPITPPIVVSATDVVDYLVDYYEVQDTAPLNDTLIDEYMGISSDDVQSYYGYISLAQGSPDCVIYVEAVEGEAENIADSLEQVRDFLESAYVEDGTAYEKANNGRVYVYDNDCYLLIGGRSELDPAEETKAMLEYLEEQYSPK